MTAVTSRRRVPTVALWGALGVLAWVLLVALFGGGAAHASDRGTPHDRPAANSGQSADRAAHPATARTERPTASHDRQTGKQQERERHGDHRARAKAPVPSHAPERALAPAKKAPAAPEQARGFAPATHAPRAGASATTAAPKKSAQRTGSTVPQPLAVAASMVHSSDDATDTAARTTSGKLAMFTGLATYAAQYDAGDHPVHAYAAKDAVTTVTEWTTNSIGNAYKAATHHARHHWSGDDSRTGSDRGRHHGHDHGNADAARPGKHRAPASPLRMAPAAPSAVASSWTRATAAHHSDATATATATAAQSTTPPEAHGSAPSDDTSADIELPGPYTPAAPSTTTLSNASGPLALASAVGDDMPVHEGTPVRAAEATQSVVPAAPVFTTDVSPD
ncbi:hypothetical protein ACFVAE_11215 [Microbacterium sp. NPDC057659]|uniref:hypothetical protein n=1 Tax=Microbacterium sp. NPDC057659 TaxID=3346198 RepID=UPI00366F9525